MFDQATVRTGIRFGVMGGISSFAVVVLIYLAGGDPYGQKSLLSYLLIPFFIVLGINYYRSFREEAVGFGKALSVAVSVTLYAAVTAALLLYAFAIMAGPEVMQRHVAEMKTMMDLTREQAIRLVGREAYEKAYSELGKRTPGQIASEDFVRRIIFGSLVSLITAFFKRK
jgi:hypothetical protein